MRFVLLLLVFCSLSAEETFVLIDVDTGEQLEAFGSNLDTRLTPCSSFKIALCLMGFDAGVLHSEQDPVWPYKDGYPSDFEAWVDDQTPASWIQRSCVWYSQELIRQMGGDAVQSYLEKWHYGNEDLSGDPGAGNGLMRGWISSSLKITPREQAQFICRMLREELSVSHEATELTRRVLLIDDQHGQLYGKTGFGSRDPNAQVGWFVGWLETQGKRYAFAYVLREKKIDLSARSVNVKKLLSKYRP